MKRIKLKWLHWVGFFLLTACSLSTEKGYYREGERTLVEITKILKKVETHEELQASVPALRKKFNRLANLLIEFRKFKENNPNREFPGLSLGASEPLFAELARLYEIPGCREIVEQAQVEAVYKLLVTQNR